MIADVVIAGAGIVGLATAYQLLQLRPGWKVQVLEKESAPALHQTGRNSGVVHSGIYYKPGSLKAKNCIDGRRELLTFCDRESIPYRTIHKLIVATEPSELPNLKELLARGQANGVRGVRLLSQSESLEIEPNVSALEALYLPECQIIDYSRVARALHAAILRQGGEVLFNERVVKFSSDGVVSQNRVYPARFFINCAGLYSDRLARASSSGNIGHRILPFRGEYYELTQEKKDLVRGLIYPVPDIRFPFLGVHLTHMMNGKIEAGPNAILATAREGYKKTDVNFKDLGDILSYPGFWKMAFKYWKAGLYEMARSSSKRLFLRDLQRLVPSIQERDLLPGGSGIRAQAVQRDGKLIYDFSIFEERSAIHVLNAPSPAATASLSIGRTIADMAIHRLNG